MAKKLANKQAKKQPKKYVLQGTSFPGEMAAAQQFLAHKEPQKAVALYQRILQRDPRHLSALYSLAVVLHRSGQNQAALAHIGKVVSLQPEHIDSQILLANVLMALGRRLDALQTLNQLATMYSREHSVYMALGNIEDECGNLDAAIENWKKAFSLNSKLVAALVNQARIHSARGEVESALSLLRRGRTIRSSHGECHYRIAMLTKHQTYSDDIQLMEQVSRQGDLKRQDKIYLFYALGKVFDDLQEYEKAFRYLEQANQLKRESLPAPYSGELESAQFSNIRNTIDAEWVSEKVLPLTDTFTPIFVVGMPRSGTSLVEQILASHSQVFGACELQDMNELIVRLQALTGQVYPGGLDTLDEKQLSVLAGQYLERVGGESAKPFIVDKMPHNFRYLGLIAILFPNARIIHCQRDPMDTCFSIYKQLFAEAHPYACDLQSLGSYYGLYRDLMAHWNEVLPGRIYNLKYEELVADIEQQSRQMLEFCGLDFESDCLAFFETRRTVNTPSQSQVRQPIYQSAVQHWRHYEAQLQPLQAALT